MTHPTPTRPSFGIMTAPMQVDYHDVLRVWREADAVPEIEHAWLFDHLMPIGGGRPCPRGGPCSPPSPPTIGRDPAEITRSVHLPVSYDRPEDTRNAIGEATAAGFHHLVLGLSAPYPADVARWVADELIDT
ncbi:hypothetical protein [Streptomyces sp. NBC_01235]|uniref:hypothetical protein n=1 Tax=Streptomyces sp. NBC_01235 TaxID=2903788 RepID=UPI002E119077|nr:hypothetical protein OG289_27010 [Streptomyces sp. NBC_01235]